MEDLNTINNVPIPQQHEIILLDNLPVEEPDQPFTNYPFLVLKTRLGYEIRKRDPLIEFGQVIFRSFERDGKMQYYVFLMSEDGSTEIQMTEQLKILISDSLTFILQNHPNFLLLLLADSFSYPEFWVKIMFQYIYLDNTILSQLNLTQDMLWINEGEMYINLNDSYLQTDELIDLLIQQISGLMQNFWNDKLLIISGNLSESNTEIVQSTEYGEIIKYINDDVYLIKVSPNDTNNIFNNIFVSKIKLEDEEKVPAIMNVKIPNFDESVSTTVFATLYQNIKRLLNTYSNFDYYNIHIIYDEEKSVISIFNNNNIVLLNNEDFKSITDNLNIWLTCDYLGNNKIIPYILNNSENIIIINKYCFVPTTGISLTNQNFQLDIFDQIYDNFIENYQLISNTPQLNKISRDLSLYVNETVDDLLILINPNLVIYNNIVYIIKSFINTDNDYSQIHRLKFLYRINRILNYLPNSSFKIQNLIYSSFFLYDIIFIPFDDSNEIDTFDRTSKFINPSFDDIQIKFIESPSSLSLSLYTPYSPQIIESHLLYESSESIDDDS